MTTATNHPSVRGRFRMLALAGTLALGALAPAAPATLASGPDDVTPTALASSAGFEISVDSVDQLSGLTAVVAGDGDGVNLRAEPAHDAEVLATVADGSVVTLRVDMVDTVYDPDGVTRWWPVAVGGQEGWMTGAYLIAPGADVASVEAPAEQEATEEVVEEAPVEATEAPTGDAYDYTGATVATIAADGDGVNLRSEPDANSDVVATLSDGTVVTLRIDQLDTVYDAAGTRWWPVTADGVEGWVSGFYLVDSNQPAPAEEDRLVPAEDAEEDVAREGAFAAGDFAEVTTASGDGATLRTEGNPEADEVGFVPEQGLVEILDGPVSFTNSENGWYEVRWDRQTGFVDGDLLTAAKAPAPAATTTPTPAADADTDTDDTDDTFADGDYAAVDSGGNTGVNVRKSATTSSERVGFLDEDAVVRITAGPESDDEGDAWYRVTDGKQSGWVAANLLTPSEAPAAEPEKTPEAAEAPGPETSASGFILPLASYRFTQDYGCSNLGFYVYDPAWGCAIHDGVDMAAPSGTPIRAVADGTVVTAGWCDCGLGYYVEIDHGNGLHSVYGHMASQPYVATGQAVNQGDTIGPVGSTGLSTGPHIHFMIRLNGVTQDPKSYLPPIGG